MKTGIVRVTFAAMENILHLPECWRVRSCEVNPSTHELKLVVEDETLPVSDGGELVPTFRVGEECGHVESVTWKPAEPGMTST